MGVRPLRAWRPQLHLCQVSCAPNALVFRKYMNEGQLMFSSSTSNCCIGQLLKTSLTKLQLKNLMFIGPCIIAIVDEWKANLMSLAILFHLLCAQHVLDINISSSGACDCVDDLPPRSSYSQFVVCWSFRLQNEHHQKPAAPKLQHTTNWEQDDRGGNSSTQSQAPEDGYINVRNMLRT